MTRLPVNYFLPAADLLWGVFTLVQYKVTNVHQLYAFRFFVGVLGGFFFPAAMWYMGCWYKRSELSRRGAFFFIASQVGSMSSSYIQAGAYSHLDGRYGIEGWRWLYIICKSPTADMRAKHLLIYYYRLCMHHSYCSSRIRLPAWHARVPELPFLNPS